MARGYTLVELLVVLLIAGLLIATALPVAATMLEDARTREASRALNAYFAMAKARASGTGRAHGVWIVPRPIAGTVNTQVTGETNYQATELYLAEMAAPYGGSSLSPASTAYADSSTKILKFGPDAATEATELAIMKSLVADGELFLIRFDYKGDWFVGIRSGNDFTVQSSALNTTSPPSVGKPFQVLRMPRATGSALEMPQGTAIDLAYSGVGQSGVEFGVATKRILVMFQPIGTVESVFFDANSSPSKPQGTLHFLVGRVEKTGATGADSNLADPTSLWVSIGAQSGVVMTSENMPNTASIPNPFTAVYIANAREAASSREQMGGR